jgi:ABC-2 type transport system ATP-binding protein
LCQRVVVIAQGTIQYDGSLTGIVDEFSGSKIITLVLGDEQGVQGLERFGEVQRVDHPRVTLKCSRTEVSKVLAEILDRYQVNDIAVEDPPLEEVIAQLFHRVSSGGASS